MCLIKHQGHDGILLGFYEFRILENVTGNFPYTRNVLG